MAAEGSSVSVAVRPLAIRLREGPVIFRPESTYYGRLVKDTTPVLSVRIYLFRSIIKRLRKHNTYHRILPLCASA